MVPDFLVAETTVRESGESQVFDSGGSTSKALVLTLGITHALEQESIEVEIYGSEDGVTWSAKPLVSFAPKSWCGTYQMFVHPPCARYLKAIWNVHRWSRGDTRPYFNFYIFAQLDHVRAMAGAA